MDTIYKTLFEVVVDHKYYDNTSSEDFVFEPNLETKRLLSRYKLVLKKGSSGFSVLHQVLEDSGQPFLELDEGIVFNFSMKLKNPAFLNFTDLPDRSSNKEIYHFGNSSIQETVDNEEYLDHKIAVGSENIIPIGSKIFSYEINSASNDVKVRVYDVSDTLIVEKQPQAVENTYKGQIDLRSYPSGEYVFQQVIDEEIKNTERIFLTDRTQFEKPFGIISILKDQSIKNDAISRFHIDFQNKSAPWKYHLKLTKDYNDYTISIKDKEKYSGSNSRYDKKINFRKRSSGNDYSRGEIVVFESGKKVQGDFLAQDIPFYQSPKKHLQLTLKNGSKNVVIDHLPNPLINNIKSEVYINV